MLSDSAKTHLLNTTANILEVDKLNGDLREARAHIKFLSDEIKYLSQRLDEAYEENDKLYAVIKKGIKILEEFE